MQIQIPALEQNISQLPDRALKDAHRKKLNALRQSILKKPSPKYAAAELEEMRNHLEAIEIIMRVH